MYYSMNVNLAGKKVVVVGGGKVAERKVAGLLGTDAMIVVISPEATDDLMKLALDGEIRWSSGLFSRRMYTGRC